MPEPGPIRLLLVEDHTLFRDLMARTLAAEPGFEIAGKCGTVSEALEVISKSSIDMVLLDINLGAEQGGALLNSVRGLGYRGKVLAVTAGVSEREAAWLLHRGCSGIFLKQEPLDTLIQRIRAVMDGTFRLDPQSLKAVLAQVSSTEQGSRRVLTQRESEVLRGVCKGLTNKEIADRMSISENAVKSFLQQLFAKTGARTRARLVAAAIEQYWDQLESST